MLAATDFVRVEAAAVSATPSVARAGSTPAKIRGYVRLFGRAPAPKPVNVDSLTAKLNPIRPLATRDFIVGTNGGLADVFVHVKSGLENWTFEAPTAHVRFEHRGCQLYPHVAATQTNQPILLYNSDPIPHPLRSVPGNSSNPPVSKAVAPRDFGTYFTTIQHPEAFLRLQCEKHSWETAYIAAASNPFFAVTDTNGSFTITNLPPGQYLLEAVHPFAGNALQFVDLQSGQQLVLDLELQLPASKAASK